MTKVFNGYDISMVNDSVGFATVSGSGLEISGGVYKLEKGNWKTLFMFPYSDAPQLKVFSETSVFTLFHQTHFGNWKYVLFHFDGKNWNRIDLPLVHWDDTDYVIINDMNGSDENDLWLVGQKAAILHFLNGKWKVLDSPVKWKTGDAAFAKDFRSLAVLNKKKTIIVGNQGLMIEANGEKLKQIKTPREDENLTKVKRISDDSVLIASDKGSLYSWNGKLFSQLDVPEPNNPIFDIEVTQHGDISILQSGKIYKKISNQNDWTLLLDISSDNSNISSFTSLGINGQNLDHIYFTGSDGLYQTNKKGNLNFREVSRDASISAQARQAIFFDANADGYLDIFLHGERGMPDGLLLNNGNGVFSDFSFQSNILKSTNGSLALTIADIDHDYDADIIKIRSGSLQLQVLRNQGNGIFSDITEWSHLSNITLSPQSLLWGNVIKLTDIDFDGDPDLIILTWGNPARIFLNNGIGQFTEIVNSWFSDFTKEKSNNRPMGFSIILNYENKIGEVMLPYYMDSIFVFTFSNHFTNLIKKETYFPDNYSGAHTTANLNLTDSTHSILVLDKNYGLIAANQPDQKPYQFSKPQIVNENTFKIPGYSLLSTAVGDFDLDGQPDFLILRDLLLGKPNHIFLNVKSSNGIQGEGNVSVGDYDNDGDLDILIAQGSEFGKNTVSLYKNQLNDTNYVKISLRSIFGNSWGFGSIIKVYPNHSVLEDSLLSQILLGFNETSGMNVVDPTTSLSTGSHQMVSVVVKFPSGKIQTIHNVENRSSLTIYDYDQPIRFLLEFSAAIYQIMQYINLLHELFRWGIIALFFIFIYRLINDTTLKHSFFSIVRIAAVIITYFTVYYLTIQLEGFLIFLLPVLSSITVGVLLLGISYVYQTYIQTNYIGPYRIIKLLGEGSSGKVFMAYSSSENRHVAVKIYHDKIFATKEGQIRFQREVATGSTLSHPGIVKMLGSGQHNKSGYIVMELVEGINLREMIVKELTVNQVVDWSIALAESLDYIHSHDILHRDIKTENIILLPNNDIKLMDLGLAKTNIFATMTRMGTSVGTLAYMSPQQAVGMPLDKTTDLYSLGVVMYELLSAGTLPISGENEMAFVYNIFNQIPESLSKYNDKVDDELEAIVVKLLGKQPEERFQSGSELIAVLSTWKENHPRNS